MRHVSHCSVFFTGGNENRELKNKKEKEKEGEEKQLGQYELKTDERFVMDSSIDDPKNYCRFYSGRGLKKFST